LPLGTAGVWLRIEEMKHVQHHIEPTASKS
jgi:hypothetical protein